MKTGAFIFVLLLCACAPAKKDYDAVARCQELGYQPGSKGYDNCLTNEQTYRMMEEQRQEFERIQQERQDQLWKRY